MVFLLPLQDATISRCFPLAQLDAENVGCRMFSVDFWFKLLILDLITVFIVRFFVINFHLRLFFFYICFLFLITPCMDWLDNHVRVSFFELIGKAMETGKARLKFLSGGNATAEHRLGSEARNKSKRAGLCIRARNPSKKDNSLDKVVRYIKNITIR